MAKGTVTVKVVGDARGLINELNGASDRLKRFGDRMSLTVTPALTALGAASVRAASDLGESMNKVEVVFGDAANSVKRFADDAATSLGQSERAALDAAAQFGNMFNSLGLARQESARMSTEMVQLATDMASLNNEDPGEMIQKLRSGLAGEAEPLRRFGVFLSEAAVQAEAVEMGLIGVGEEMTESEKVLARYSLIMESTGTAQGDFARTADSVANQQRVLAARFEDVRAELGENLLPVMSDALDMLNGLLTTFGDLPEPVQNLALSIGGAFAVAGPAMSGIARLTSGVKTVHDNLGNIAAFMRGPWGIALAAAGTAMVSFGARHLETESRVRELQEGLRNLIVTAEQAGQEAGRTVRQIAEEISAALESDSAANFAKDIADILDQAFTGGAPKVERAARIIGDAIQGVREESAALATSYIEAAIASEDLIRTTEGLAIEADNGVQALVLTNAQIADLYRNVRESIVVMPQLADATGALADESGNAADETGSLAEEMGEARSRAEQLRDAIDRLFGAQVNIDQATISYRDRLAEMVDELTNGSRSLDVMTETGRTNRQSILDVIEAHGSMLTALEESDASVWELIGTHNTFRGELAEVLEQAGLTEEQIRDLNEEYGLVPGRLETELGVTGLQESLNRFREFERGIEGIGTRVAGLTARVGIDVRAALAGVQLSGDGPGVGGGPNPPVSVSVSRGGVGDGPGSGSTPQRLEDALKLLDVDAATSFRQTGSIPLGVSGLGPAAGVPAMMEALRQLFPGLPLHSGYRPGAITATGRRSYHGMMGASGPGRAVDIPPNMAVFNAIRNSAVAAITRELIFSPAGANQLHNGRNHYYSGITRANHWDHIHWALANGGIVRATPGGTRTILGDGGSDEAVIPLDRPLPVVFAGMSSGTDPTQAILDLLFPGFGTPIVGAPTPPPQTGDTREEIADRLEEEAEQAAEEAARLQEEIRRANQARVDAARQEVEEQRRRREEQRRAIDQLAVERDRVNEQLGSALRQRADLESQLQQAERDHLRAVVRLREQEARQIEAVLDVRRQQLVAFSPQTGSQQQGDLPFLLGFGLVDVGGGPGGASDRLVDQLRASNAELAEFIATLGRLRGEGLSEQTIALLGLDQPQQVELLRELAGYTLEEIDELNRLVADRYGLANSQVATEQQQLLGTVGESLVALRAQTAEAMASLAEQFELTSSRIAESVAEMTSQIEGLLAQIARLNAQIAAGDSDFARRNDSGRVVGSGIAGGGSSGGRVGQTLEERRRAAAEGRPVGTLAGAGGTNPFGSVTINVSSPSPISAAQETASSLRALELSRGYG